MSREPSGRGARAEPDEWQAFSYVVGGIAVWGGAGWLLDTVLGTRGFVAAGLVLGAFLGVFLVFLRYGRP